MTKVAEINTEVLQRFIRGQQSQDNAVLTAIMAFNVAIRMDPNMKYPFNTRSFFTDAGRRVIGAGLELWQGYFQSLRPSQGKLYINIDISTGIMYKSGPLLDLCLEFLGQRDPKLLSHRARFPDRERLRLQRFISNMRIITTYGTPKTHVVRKVSEQGASAITFTLRDGTTTTVANYFRNQLNRPLRFPDTICIDVGSGGMIPLELCNVIPGQIMRKQIPPDKTSDVLDFSKKAPADRLAAIRAGLGVLQYGQSDYIRKFGLNITETPMTVPSRVLQPPMLRYGPGSNQPTIRPSNGQWNMRDKKLFKPQVINTWVVVIYETRQRFGEQVAENMVKGFIEGARSVGITVRSTEPLITWENGQGDISSQLKKAGKASYDRNNRTAPSLIVVVLPEIGNQIYTAVKHFGDVEMGVATQCLKGSKCFRANLQYWANVMLKVNAKLGGVNAILDNSPLSDPNHPTIVMGADVIHPAPGAEGRPSFTSLVSSVDRNTAKYIAISKVQTGRQEMIDDLEEMVKYALAQYGGYRKQVENLNSPPSRLIFYRDGVSEGQFQQVLDEELPAIKKACKDLKINIKITLIVVGKRHHIRMFPERPGDGDRSGNCQAGTTIDEGIGHPTEFDYYQLTHGGLLGTSRPAHYSVIHDDNTFSADAMQNLSFSLTHVYARATRSVSIPAPVYYADIVCARSKNHYAPSLNLDGSDAASQASQATAQLELYKREYKPLHTGVARNMYFM